MSTGSTTKLLKAEEFFDWVHLPENTNKWFELVRGEVIELPPPTKPHGVVCINVGYVLSSYSRHRRKGYVTGNDSGVILEHDPDTVRGPDVAYYEDAQTFAELHPKYGEVPRALRSRSYRRTTGRTRSCERSWIISRTVSSWSGWSIQVLARSPSIVPTSRRASSKRTTS